MRRYDDRDCESCFAYGCECQCATCRNAEARRIIEAVTPRSEIGNAIKAAALAALETQRKDIA